MDDFKVHSDFGLWNDFEYDLNEVDNISKFKKRIEVFSTPVFYSKDSNHFINSLKYIKYRLNEDLELYRESPTIYRKEDKLPQIINWIDNKIWELERSKSTIPTPVKALALYYYYCQKENEELSFLKHPNGITKAIVEAAEKHNVGVGSFRDTYYKLTKDENRIVKGNLQHVLRAIDLLDEYPKAKKLAQKELKTIELLP